MPIMWKSFIKVEGSKTEEPFIKLGEQLQRKCQEIKEELKRMSYVTVDELVAFINQIETLKAEKDFVPITKQKRITVYCKGTIVMGIPYDSWKWSAVLNIPDKMDLNSAFIAKMYERVDAFLSTPLDYRGLGPKYQVRLKGLNSDNGPQYLSTSNPSNMSLTYSRVFACAANSNLKQAFTRGELLKFVEKAADNQNDWLYQLVHDENNWEPYGGNNEL